MPEPAREALIEIATRGDALVALAAATEFTAEVLGVA
jgi:hypothetical protein